MSCPSSTVFLRLEKLAGWYTALASADSLQWVPLTTWQRDLSEQGAVRVGLWTEARGTGYPPADFDYVQILPIREPRSAATCPACGRPQARPITRCATSLSPPGRHLSCCRACRFVSSVVVVWMSRPSAGPGIRARFHPLRARRSPIPRGPACVLRMPLNIAPGVLRHRVRIGG